MSLSNLVRVSRNFLRSVRIDTDLSASSLEGFVFPPSLKELLLNMGDQQSKSRQGAYTWTGPYGSGKSSLAMVLTHVLSGTLAERENAANVINDAAFIDALEQYLPPKQHGWHFVNVIGELESPHISIAKRLHAQGYLEAAELDSESAVIDILMDIALRNENEYGGLILVIDEMGKFLERSAAGSNDIYFFQLLAEKASRSKGRLIVIGILHQAFQEYANKLGREIRDEWAKIQGRFADISVNISGEEQVSLIAKALVTEEPPKSIERLFDAVSRELTTSSRSYGNGISETLASVWPLHPITALMLGPISRRSYGQNQRSIFTFLNSAEPLGFQDFLENADEDMLFTPADYWDYLIQNLQSSLAVSADSHHISVAKEAIDRCVSLGGSPDEITLIKSLALLELTRSQSGLNPNTETLSLCLFGRPRSEVEVAIKALEEKSLIVFREYRGSYGLFEGSDFDIEGALEVAAREVTHVDLSTISNAIGISTIAAKRHYHETGTMRWCDFLITPVEELASLGEKSTKPPFSMGIASLALPTNGEDEATISKAISEALCSSRDYDLLIANSPKAHRLVSLAREHTLIAHIKENCREIDRDKVARREVKDRLDAITGLINQEVWNALASAEWSINAHQKRRLSWPQLNSIVSDLAAKRFAKAPVIHNELINRRSPSASANGALKLLLHAMVLHGNKEQLGFEKFPAEKGLFCSIIEANNLHRKLDSEWHFVSPLSDKHSTLHSLWQATSEFLAENANRNVSLAEIYSLWRSEPFGICDGIMPLFVVLYLLTERSNLAYYRDGIFLSNFTDIDVDYLLKAPNTIDFRWMDMSDLSRRLLSNMADIASALSGKPVLNLEPLDVARALIAAYESAAPWAHKTSRLSHNAIQVRSLFKRSRDPNKFLFDDIPALYSDEVDITSEESVPYISQNIRDGLQEILNRYPEMLRKLGDQVLQELQVPSVSPQAIQELNARAANIKGITGNMRLENFIGRLINFDNSYGAIEKLASLSIKKPPKMWVDSDIDRATISLIEFARAFNKSEAYAQVDGRPNKRNPIAVVVGMDGQPMPVVQEFDILDSDRTKVSSVAADLQKALLKYKDLPSNIALAALATVCASVVDDRQATGNKENSRGQG